MKKLSEIAWEKCLFAVEAIKEHPFNTELAEGSLDRAKFSYYIEQDALYLQDFARSFALIVARGPVKFMKDFLSFAEFAFIAEQEVVHHFFRETFHIQETHQLTPATLAYTSYLLRMSSTASVEVAIAAILPCFWVYKVVGEWVAKNSVVSSQNPYLRWIETYSSQEFSGFVGRAIDIFDEVAISASDTVREEMVEAFYKSTILEWHFWNDAYNQTVFDTLI
ncbi:thiaminase II [Rhabdochlamydiaceae symbiont of Dictyostelium giganteum]|uniref:thiaminase II n=1 Tax=Rhabdochlamydiaceae symbiont of Dictyostelium giganteum TaxID=3342349 RepID=UPI00384CE7BA